MFSDALNFNHHLGEWKLSSSVSTENMFSGATSFQAKFTCASATNGPPNTCALKWKMNKLSFASCERRKKAFENVKVIVTDEVWKSIDTNGDGDLDDTEFARINRLMRYGYAYGIPWLVYPTLEMRDMRSFGIHRPLSTNERESHLSTRSGWILLCLRAKESRRSPSFGANVEKFATNSHASVGRVGRRLCQKQRNDRFVEVIFRPADVG